MKCLLDIDGVLADFVSGAYGVMGRPVPEKYEWDFVDDDAWPKMGFSFWASLSVMPLAHEIVSACEETFGAENVCLLSSPVLTPGCMDGKLAWISTHFPQFSRRFLFGSAKQFCASPCSVLVDDYDVNAQKFHAAGGNAILIPRVYNTRAGQLVETAVAEIRSLKGWGE